MRLSIVLVALLFTACASAGRTTNNGRDAHVATPDGGHADATAVDGGHDAGAEPDMGTERPDVGMFDTGVAPHDAGLVRPDAFALDMGSMAPDTGCASAAACSDGIGCNGIERCESGRCVPGTPVTCDDGLACTTDACVEPGMCQYTSTCAGGGACGPTGCAGSCSETPCRLLGPQCGCGAGQGCYPSGTTRACAPAGVGTPGAACSSASSCAPGNVCQDVSTSGAPVNVCSRVCTSDGDCGNGLCVIPLDDGTGHAAADLRLCSHGCNVVTQSGCPSGTACGLLWETTGAMRPLTECTAPVGTRTTDQSCSGDEDCRAGFLCLDGGDGFGVTCHRVCAYPSSSVCPVFQDCVDFTTPVIVNGIEYGVCD